MKKITTLSVLLLVFSSIGIFAQSARLQVIHNAADIAAAQVDVYVNGALLLDNFAFRTATPFVDVPAGVPLTIDVAPASSTSVAESIYSVTATLGANETYIAVANGIVSPTGYTPNQPFGLYIYPTARETANVGTNTDVLVFHGSSDAPMVDVQAVGAGTVVNDISYGNFNDYLELPTADYTLNVATADGATIVASYAAPLQTLGLNGQALTVLASGFLDPSQNSNGPAFGLWVALASGGNLVELPAADPTARLQVIHNAADVAASQVDVYVNGALLLDNFAFRTATPFVNVPAGVPLTIDVAPAGSTSAAESIYSVTTTLDANETYIAIANGIVSPTGYTPNQPFGLYIYPAARETANVGTNTDVLVFHGSSDAPTVDVQAVGAGTIVNDISYGNFNDYLELPTADYTLNVATADGATIVASYAAPLQTLGLDGQALTVLASGFLDPSQNSNGPAFGLWAALASGGNLVELPLANLATKTFETRSIVAYPNPATSSLYLSVPFGHSKIQNLIFDQNGRKVLTNSSESIDVSGLATGIYMLESSIDDTVYRNKIVIGN